MKLNKIISCIIALTMIISMFSCVTVSAASLDGLTLIYTFAEGTAKGVADGIVTISGITEELQADITNVNIYWGKNATDRLDSYLGDTRLSFSGANAYAEYNVNVETDGNYLFEIRSNSDDVNTIKVLVDDVEVASASHADTNGGQQVWNLMQGAYLVYNLNIDGAAAKLLSARITKDDIPHINNNEGSFSVYLDDVLVGTITNYDVLNDYSFTDQLEINLKAGRHTLKFDFANVGMKMNYVQLDNPGALQMDKTGAYLRLKAGDMSINITVADANVTADMIK